MCKPKGSDQRADAIALLEPRSIGSAQGKRQLLHTLSTFDAAVAAAQDELRRRNRPKAATALDAIVWPEREAQRRGLYLPYFRYTSCEGECLRADFACLVETHAGMAVFELCLLGPSGRIALHVYQGDPPDLLYAGIDLEDGAGLPQMLVQAGHSFSRAVSHLPLPAGLSLAVKDELAAMASSFRPPLSPEALRHLMALIPPPLCLDAGIYRWNGWMPMPE